MKKSQRRARRLALCLSSIGVSLFSPTGSYEQWAGELEGQLRELTAEQRNLAETSAQRLMKESGSILKALEALVPSVLFRIPPGKTAPTTPRRLSREEHFSRVQRRWSTLTPPCPTCRMTCGFPKRSWPSQEWAEEVRARQHDRDLLQVYPCPVQVGFWHLGHQRPSVHEFAPPDVTALPAESCTAAPTTGGL
jgi:hypothetical protein